jgi:hypothetical protein
LPQQKIAGTPREHFTVDKVFDVVSRIYRSRTGSA